MFAGAGVAAHHTYQAKMLEFAIAIDQGRVQVAVGERAVSVGTAVGGHVLRRRRPREHAAR